VFPGFQALDVFGPLDALNMLSMSHKMELAVIARSLEPVSTKVNSPTSKAQSPEFAQSIIPTHTFETCPALDVLIVPGGMGTRGDDLNDIIAFIKARYPSCEYLITVCTGASLAARSGVLDGKRATTNKNAFAWVKSTGPKVHWIGHARWVTDGNIWTAAGVAAGIDCVLAWMEAVYGRDMATKIANMMEYEQHTDPSWDPFAKLHNLPADT